MFTTIKTKLQDPAFQAEAKVVAKAVAGQILLSATVAIGTVLVVKGVQAISEKGIDLAKDLFSGEDVEVIDQTLVDDIANS